MNEKNDLLNNQLNLLRKKVSELEREIEEVRNFFNETEKSGKIGGWHFDPLTLKQTWTDEVFRILEIDLEDGAPEVPQGLEFIDPDFRPMAEKAIQRAMVNGESYNQEWIVTTARGNKKWVNAVCNPKTDNGKVVSVSGSFQDITDKKIAEEDLKRIEWLLQHKKKKTEARIPDYGDLTVLNRNRTILDSVGKEMLDGIVTDYLTLLETSAAVYEKNGDYAVGIFSSEWCQFMDHSSRALCNSKDNRTALESGKWLCHESCWEDASKKSIQTNKAVDVECSGGLHIYAIPIRTNNEVIGSINFGYGGPPTNEDKLSEIAARYKVSKDKLKELAKGYETRPEFIIDIAKEKLDTSAKLIGNIVERNQLEEELLKSLKRYKKAQEIGHVGNWEYNPVTTNFWASDESKRIYGFDLGLKNFTTDMVEGCIPERERVHQALVDLLEQNKKYDLVFDIITHDKGIRKTIHSIAEVERDTKGNPLKITGVINDITIQKKAENELYALNLKLIANQQELQAANQEMQANDQQLRATNHQLQANEQQLRAANQQLQANEQQLRAANQQLQANEQQLRAANQQLQANEQQLGAANQQLQANEQQLRAANKQLNREKERAERNENYYHNIINKIGDPVFVKDDKSRLLLVNDAFCKLFDLQRSDIIG